MHASRYAPLAAAVGRWPHRAEAARSEETAAKAWYQRTQRSSLRQKKNAVAAASRLRANEQQKLSSPALASSNISINSSSTYPPLPPFRSWSNSGLSSRSRSGSSSCSSLGNFSRSSSGLDGGRSELHMAASLGLDEHLA